METLLIASDHAGFKLKLKIKEHFKNTCTFEDLGPDGTDRVDYPDFASKVAETISKAGARSAPQDQAPKGILICGSGIGMSITANKFKGVRAALCENPLSARLSREHNDSNILCMGERIVGEALAFEIVQAWLDGKFLGDRHQERLAKITEIENQN